MSDNQPADSPLWAGLQSKLRKVWLDITYQIKVKQLWVQTQVELVSRTVQSKSNELRLQEIDSWIDYEPEDQANVLADEEKVTYIKYYVSRISWHQHVKRCKCKVYVDKLAGYDSQKEK